MSLQVVNLNCKFCIRYRPANDVDSLTKQVKMCIVKGTICKWHGYENMTKGSNSENNSLTAAAHLKNHSNFRIELLVVLKWNSAC